MHQPQQIQRGHKRQFEDDIEEPRTTFDKCQKVTRGQIGKSQDITSINYTPIILQRDGSANEDELTNKAKQIYSCMRCVEKECVGSISQDHRLDDDQWQALVSRHHTLLNKYYKFFWTTQHPSASPALKRLATAYALPARLWNNVIFPFLEFLRHRLPTSYEHLLTFTYFTYSMMGLLMESVPGFQTIWIECLGDLASYRTAIGDLDVRDRRRWSNVARRWYDKTADLNPGLGRLQHHLAVVAHPKVIVQLFYFSKALIAAIPFQPARKSIVALTSAFLDRDQAVAMFQKHSVLESSLITAFGILFTRGDISEFKRHAQQFCTQLKQTIGASKEKWMFHGPAIIGIIIAGLFDFGNEKNFLWQAFNDNVAAVKACRLKSAENDPMMLELEDHQSREKIRKTFWQFFHGGSYKDRTATVTTSQTKPGSRFESSVDVVAHVLPLFYQTISTVAARIEDQNIIPFMSFTFSFLWSLAHIPGGLLYLEAHIPWHELVAFLNHLHQSLTTPGKDQSISIPEYPSDERNASCPAHPPSEYRHIRDLIWAQTMMPMRLSGSSPLNEGEGNEYTSNDILQCTRRCLWLGMRLASLDRYFEYDGGSKRFQATVHASNYLQRVRKTSVLEMKSSDDKSLG